MATAEKENLVKAPERRTRRNPVEGRNRLKVRGEDPNYVYRIVNDVDDRISEYLDKGWEFETSEKVRIGDSRLVDNPNGDGFVRVMSVGGGMKAILMRIKREWYDEDQEAKLGYVKETEKAMRPDPNEGMYGSVDVTRR